MIPLPPRSTLFPYTTFFRSDLHRGPGVPRSLYVVSGRRDTQFAPPVQPRQGGRRVPSGEVEQAVRTRSEEHTSELQSHSDLVCRLLLEKKKKISNCLIRRHN